MRKFALVGIASIALVVGFVAGYASKTDKVSSLEIGPSFAHSGYKYETLTQYIDAHGVLYALLVPHTESDREFAKPFWMAVNAGVLHDRQGHLMQFLPTQFTVDTVFWKAGNPFKIDIFSS